MRCKLNKTKHKCRHIHKFMHKMQIPMGMAMIMMYKTITQCVNSSNSNINGNNPPVSFAMKCGHYFPITLNLLNMNV